MTPHFLRIYINSIFYYIYTAESQRNALPRWMWEWSQFTLYWHHTINYLVCALVLILNAGSWSALIGLRYQMNRSEQGFLHDTHVRKIIGIWQIRTWLGWKSIYTVCTKMKLKWNSRKAYILKDYQTFEAEPLESSHHICQYFPVNEGTVNLFFLFSAPTCRFSPFRKHFQRHAPER